MDFYYVSASAPCRSVLMLAKALGIELNKKVLDVSTGAQLKPEFLKLNPQHTIPTLVDGDFAIWESRAILVYLVEKYAKNDALFPRDPKKQAVVNQRLYFDMGTLMKSWGDYYYPTLIFKKPGDPEMYKKMETAFEFLNIFLESSKYAAGDKLTVADFALLSSVSTFKVVDFDFSKYTNVVRWYADCETSVSGFKENWEGCLELKKYFEAK